MKSSRQFSTRVSLSLASMAMLANTSMTAAQSAPATPTDAQEIPTATADLEGADPRFATHGFVSPGFDDRLLGDLYGSRRALADLGLDVELLATTDLSASSGGMEDFQTGQYLLDLSITFDLGTAKLLDGGTIFADLQYWNWFGDSPLGVGDYWGWDVMNPVLGDEIFQLSELWWQQKLGDSGVTATVGKIDSNRFFAIVPNAGPFLHVADTEPATMLGYLPTYPNPAFGAMVQWQFGGSEPTDTKWLAQAGIFDGSSAAYNTSTGSNGPRTGNRGLSNMFDGGTFVIADFGPTWNLGTDGWRGNATVGAWMQIGETIRSTAVGTKVVDDSGGLYFTITQDLHDADDSATRFELFSQTGWSDPSKVQAEWSTAAGVICRSPFAARPDDCAGFMAGVTLFSDDPLVYTAPGSTATGGNEGIFELFYRFQLDRGIVLQPDVQYISSPGGGDPSAVDGAFIATLRVEVAF
jgi:carbohydrate-selective porin OprB